MERLEFHAMGSHMLALVDGASRERLDQVPAWFEEWEQVLSRFREDSELNSLSRRAGTPTRVGDVLWQVIQASLQAARETNGLVTPTLLAALEHAGYDRSFDAIEPSRELTEAVAEPRPLIGDWRSIVCDPATQSVSLPINLRLDLGGIAKGWAADQAARRLSQDGPALVDAGGDLAISGPLADGESWSIGVADPAEPERDLEVLWVPRGGVATSGRDYRRWQVNGAWRHHIIDPRTGEPAETDVITATAVAPTAVQAEAAAKKLLILGSQAGLTWLDRQPDLAGLLVLEDRTVVHSRAMELYQRN